MDRTHGLFMTKRLLRSTLVAYLFTMAIPHTAAIQSSLMGIAIACVIAQTILSSQIPFKRTPLDILILVYAAIIIIRTVTSFDVDYSFNTMKKEFLKQILFFYLVSSTMHSHRYTQRLLTTLLISVGIVAGIGIFGYFEGSLIKDGRATSFFNNFGRAAFYTSMILPIALGRFLCSKGWWRTFSFIVLLLCLAFMIVTMSRGAWISSLLAVSILAALKDRRMLVILLIGVISTPWFLPADIIERATSIMKVFQFSESETLGDRFWMWHSALEMIKDHPWMGAGYGNRIFQRLYPDYIHSRSSGIVFENAHNLYLQMTIETGLLGLFSFLALIVGIFWILLRMLCRSPDQAQEGQLLGLAGSFAVFLIFSFTTYRYENETGLLFWFLAGCAVALYRTTILNDSDT